MLENDTIPISYLPSKAGTYRADLYGYIESTSQFADMITVMNLMTEEDEFILNLSSGGGLVDATDTFLHAVRGTKGHFHVVATGNVSSAASIILLHADSFELSDGFSSLIHCGSIGSGGNFNTYRKETAFYNAFTEKNIRSSYEGFFTEKELDDILDGKDFWLDAEQWIERHKLRNEYFTNKLETMTREAEGLVEDVVKPKRIRKKLVAK